MYAEQCRPEITVNNDKKQRATFEKLFVFLYAILIEKPNNYSTLKYQLYARKH